MSGRAPDGGRKNTPRIDPDERHEREVLMNDSIAAPVNPDAADPRNLARCRCQPAERSDSSPIEHGHSRETVIAHVRHPDGVSALGPPATANRLTAIPVPCS